MQNDQTYSDIIDPVSTKTAIQLLTNELDLLHASLYKTGTNSFETVLKTSVRSSVADVITKLTQTADKVVVIKQLQDEIAAIQDIDLTLAIDPNQKTLAKIIVWLTSVVHQKLALNITVDHSIIGGVVIAFAGKYFDFSLRSKLEKILQTYA